MEVYNFTGIPDGVEIKKIFNKIQNKFNEKEEKIKEYIKNKIKNESTVEIYREIIDRNEGTGKNVINCKSIIIISPNDEMFELFKDHIRRDIKDKIDDSRLKKYIEDILEKEFSNLKINNKKPMFICEILSNVFNNIINIIINIDIVYYDEDK